MTTKKTERTFRPQMTEEERAMYPTTCISPSCDSNDTSVWRRGLCGVCYTRDRTRIASGIRHRDEITGEIKPLSWELLESLGWAAPLLPEHEDEIKPVDLSVTSEGVSAGMDPNAGVPGYGG